MLRTLSALKDLQGVLAPSPRAVHGLVALQAPRAVSTMRAVTLQAQRALVGVVRCQRRAHLGRRARLRWSHWSHHNQRPSPVYYLEHNHDHDHDHHLDPCPEFPRSARFCQHFDEIASSRPCAAVAPSLSSPTIPSSHASYEWLSDSVTLQKKK